MNKLFLFLLLTGCCGLDTKPKIHLKEPARNPASLEETIKESLCNLLVSGHRDGYANALVDVQLMLRTRLTDEQKAKLQASDEELIKVIHSECMRKK